MVIIFVFPNIENPRYDITHYFWGCSPHTPPGAWGRPCWGWGYPKMKMVIIFGFPTIENFRIDITHDSWWYTPSSPPNPP